MMNDIVFKKGEGMLGRTLASKDHYCGLLYYGALPTGFSSQQIEKLNSLVEAEDKGITADADTADVKILHYHLQCFFDVYGYRGIKPDFWLMCVEGEPTDFAHLTALANAADGDLRKIGIYTKETLTASMVKSIQELCIALEEKHKPLSAVLSANVDLANSANIIDLGVLKSNTVHVTVGQDGAGSGAELYRTVNQMVGNVGSLLAWSSIKAVHENIGWVAKFDVAFNGEFDTPALIDGSLVSQKEGLINDLDTKRYIVLRKHTGIGGTYFNDSHAATAETSDYAYMENNDVINKAIRSIRSYLLPLLSSPLKLDADTGKLSVGTIAIFENEAYRAINDMTISGEIGGGRATIDPEQDVLATSQLAVDVELVINGVARKIQVNIGFTKKLD